MFRSQPNLRRMHSLAPTAFDIQEWTVDMFATGIDETKHYLRWREPNLVVKGLNNAFMRSYEKHPSGGTDKADKGIPDFELSQRAREDMITHDYTRSSCGHRISMFKTQLNDKHKADAVGFGEWPEKGHFLLLRNGADTTRYRIDKIDYYRDPSDMWVAALSFSPRTN